MNRYIKIVQSLILFGAIALSSFGVAQNALILNGSVTVLNGGTAGTPVYLVVNEPDPSGIARLGGHISSENQHNYVKWVSGTNTGNYVFPFGVGGALIDYIPFTFNKTTVGSSNIDMSTWVTNQQNLPHAAATNVGAVTSMTGAADSILYAVDRFWDIQTSGPVSADLTFSYLGSENTTASPLDTVRAMHWNGTSWDAPVGLGDPGVVAGVGTAGPYLGQTTFSPWILSVVSPCPSAVISYSSNYCYDDTATYAITFSGDIGGVFSASPAGLAIDTLTGSVVPANSAPGTYTVSYTIDSTLICPVFIATTTITILPPTITNLSVSICQGDSALLGGAYQNSNGIYNDTLVGFNTCDSIVMTTLTIVIPVVNNVNVSICQGDSILLGGSYQNSAGVFNDTLVGPNTCDSIVITTLTVDPALSILAGITNPICYGDLIVLTATSSGNGTITWYSDSAGTTVIGTGSPFSPTVPVPGTYTYYVNEDGSCPTAMDSVVVIVGGVQAIINANPLSGPIPLSVFFGNGSTTGAGISYNWNFGDGNISTQFQPSNTFGAVGSYTTMLIVTDGICSDTAYVDIETYESSGIVIPNVFTPNGDGNNDFFFVQSVNLESLNCEIYNRWGQLMYNYDTIKGFWDGRTLSGSEVPDGTYFIIVKAVGIDGTEFFKKGTVSLIR